MGLTLAKSTKTWGQNTLFGDIPRRRCLLNRYVEKTPKHFFFWGVFSGYFCIIWIRHLHMQKIAKYKLRSRLQQKSSEVCGSELMGNTDKISDKPLYFPSNNSPTAPDRYNPEAFLTHGGEFAENDHNVVYRCHVWNKNIRVIETAGSILAVLCLWWHWNHTVNVDNVMSALTTLKIFPFFSKGTCG